MNHSIIEHRANYYYVRLEEDYLTLCNANKGKASIHCKALILSILEHWMNDKKSKGKELYVYMTYPQWVASMYGMYARNVIINCLAELEQDHLIMKRPCRTSSGKDSFEYILNVEEIQERIRNLPGKSANDVLPDAFKNQRVEKSTGLEINGKPSLPVEKSTANRADAFKKGRTLESLTYNQSNIESDSFAQTQKPASSPSQEKPKRTSTRKPKQAYQYTLMERACLDTFNSCLACPEDDQNPQVIGQIKSLVRKLEAPGNKATIEDIPRVYAELNSDGSYWQGQVTIYVFVQQFSAAYGRVLNPPKPKSSNGKAPPTPYADRPSNQPVKGSVQDRESEIFKLAAEQTARFQKYWADNEHLSYSEACVQFEKQTGERILVSR